MTKEFRNKLFRFLHYGDTRKKTEIVEDMKELDGEFETEFPWFDNPSSGCPVFYEDILEARDGEHYSMSLVGQELQWAIQVIEQGIDSRLQACFLPKQPPHGRGDGSSYMAGKVAVLNDQDVFAIQDQRTGRLELNLSPESLCVFCRRLAELDNPEDPEQERENPGSLVSGILDTLGFDDSGRLKSKERRNADRG